MTLESDVRATHRVAPDIARSWLLVPGTKPDTFTPATASDVDAVILDLEDACAVGLKAQARADVVAWLRSGGVAWVRINDATTEFWAQDLAALSGIDSLLGVMLAKTESAEQVDSTAARLPEGTPIVALVESALGVESASAIAAAEATFRIAFGIGDFRRDTGMSDDPSVLAYPRARLVVASRAARIAAPIDGPTLAKGDEILFAHTEITAAHGMGGKLCLDPKQAEIINRTLSPSSGDVVWAAEIIKRLGRGGSAIKDGSDLPRLAKARKIFDLAAAFDLTRAPDPGA